MTKSLSDVRIGSQTPRIESYPLFATTAGDDAIDLARELAGLTLDPWQEHVLRCSLGEKPGGKWSSFRVALTVPRQNGKNALIEARELAGLFLFGEKRIIHTAHEVKTARESMTALMNRMKASDELMSHVEGFAGDFDKDFSGMKVGNDPSITLKNGNKISYAARSKGSGRGFTGDLIIMDEAYALKAEELAAMLPTMAAKSMLGNPQVWFTSSAGMPESDLLNGIRNEGINRSSDRLAYFEWSAKDDAAIDDVAAWYEANPGLGIRISEQYVLDELESMVSDGGSDEQFKRERLGIWAKLGGESIFPSGMWESCAQKPSQAGDVLSFAVDVPPSRDSATIAMASALKDGSTHVEIVDRRAGTSWVSTRLAELRDKWSPTSIILDAGGAAGALMSEMKRDGVKSRQLNAREYGQACGMFFDLVIDGKLVHIGQVELDSAVEGAKQAPMGDTLWKWNRKNPVVDISPLVAVTLALHGLSVRPRNQDQTRKVVVF